MKIDPNDKGKRNWKNPDYWPKYSEAFAWVKTPVRWIFAKQGVARNDEEILSIYFRFGFSIKIDGRPVHLGVPHKANNQKHCEVTDCFPCTPEGWIRVEDGLPEVKRSSDGDGVGLPAMSQTVLWLRKDGVWLMGALETYIENKVAIGFVPAMNGCEIPGYISIRDKPLRHGGISCALSSFTHWMPGPQVPGESK